MIKEYLWGDQLMILFSREILKDRKGATFVAEVKCSRICMMILKNRGSDHVATGHSLIKEKMREERRSSAER